MTVCKMMHKLLITLLVVALCFSSISVYAAVDLDVKGCIKISALDRESETPIDRAAFRIYRFAEAIAVGDSVHFAYTADFADNGMDMGNFSDAYLPVHLTAYADTNALAYTEQAVDATGTVTFDQLPCGAYLIVPTSIADGYLIPSPFIVSIPTKDEKNDTWAYQIHATPKTTEDDTTTDTTSIAVKKQWRDNGTTPNSVTVSLIKDSVVVDTVSLNAQNNWYHKWEQLDKSHAWHVVETDVPAEYEVSYTSSQMTVIITNTRTDNTTTTTPSNPTTSTTKPDQLVQTGQLNWPIPILLIVGLLLVSLGWALLNFGHKEEENV